MRAIKLNYTRDELMAERTFASRIERDGVLFHGGLDRTGAYIPPRSRHRPSAIAAWTDQLRAGGHRTEVVTAPQVARPFLPNVSQAKLLLRHGARDTIARILTLIGISEGFGNDGLKLLPQLDLQRFFKQSIADTCLAHLHLGLFEAHGNDEAGRGDEAGHDVMWFAIRDAALDKPRITADMFENLPIAPPPGYSGPARPAPNAVSVVKLAQRGFPVLDPVLELFITALAQILVLELMAYSTFRWARKVLADPAASAAPEFAPWMVACIQRDEDIHVSYLQCALSEVRARTLLDRHGEDVAGAVVVDAICKRVVRQNVGSRWDRMMAFRMGQIRSELAARSDGRKILNELVRFGRTSPARTRWGWKTRTTVCWPEGYQEALRDLAHGSRTSMNKLIIAAVDRYLTDSAAKRLARRCTKG